MKRAITLTGMILLATTSIAAENIDPIGDGNRYAWAENLGWINAEPSGDGGPGVEVADFELTGYLWSENGGWISLSCKNDSSCGSMEYGVRNDGNGTLSGFAWSENLGWIDFGPAASGVTIDVATGEFGGRAWGENLGWITFASSGATPFKITTAWSCLPAPAAPVDEAELFLEKTGADTSLSWAPVTGATGYDVVRGDLETLRASSGDFSVATDTCLADNRTTNQVGDADVPVAGGGSWFLVRPANCGGAGSFGSERDAGIATAAVCP